MRWNLWLAQPETERLLGAILRITVAAVALWTLAAAYGVWSTRAALATAQLSVLSQSNQISRLACDLPKKRGEAQKAAEVEVISSEGAGSAEITVEFANLARVAGAEVRGVRIGDSGQTLVAVQAAPSPTAQVPAGADAWTQETFECNIVGEYPALTRFLSGLAASRRILNITALQVMRGDAKAHPGTPRLEMKISGTVDETSEKS